MTSIEGWNSKEKCYDVFGKLFILKESSYHPSEDAPVLLSSVNLKNEISNLHQVTAESYPNISDDLKALSSVTVTQNEKKEASPSSSRLKRKTGKLIPSVIDLDMDLDEFDSSFHDESEEDSDIEPAIEKKKPDGPRMKKVKQSRNNESNPKLHKANVANSIGPFVAPSSQHKNMQQKCQQQEKSQSHQDYILQPQTFLTQQPTVQQQPVLPPQHPAFQPQQPAFQPQQLAFQPQQPAFQPQQPTLQPRPNFQSPAYSTFLNLKCDLLAQELDHERERRHSKEKRDLMDNYSSKFL
jgi:hypothetical protein